MKKDVETRKKHRKSKIEEMTDSFLWRLANRSNTVQRLILGIAIVGAVILLLTFGIP